MNKPTPRPHVETIKAWADGAQIEWRHRQPDRMFPEAEWTECPCPIWSEEYEYRVKRQQATAVTTTLLYPLAEVAPPWSGACYYLPCVATPADVIRRVWHNTNLDWDYLQQGLVHLTRTCAIAHGQALREASQNFWQQNLG